MHMYLGIYGVVIFFIELTKFSRMYNVHSTRRL